jgi:hypothetical protein
MSRFFPMRTMLLVIAVCGAARAAANRYSGDGYACFSVDRSAHYGDLL